MLRVSVGLLAVIIQALVCVCQNPIPTDPITSFPNGGVDCFTRCESTSVCSGVDPGRNPEQEANSACAYCIEGTCAFSRQNDRNRLPGCIADAWTTCSACPNPTSQQLLSLQNCRNCVDECQGSSNGSCTGYCKSVSFCPTDDEIIDSLEGTTTQCRSCVTNECEAAFSQSDRSVLAACLYRVRGECSVCLLNSEERLARRYCGDCVAQCDVSQSTTTVAPTVTVSGRMISSVSQPNPVVNNQNYFRPTGLLNRFIQRNLRYTIRNALRPSTYNYYQPYRYQPYIYQPYYPATRLPSYNTRRYSNRRRRNRRPSYYTGYRFVG